MGISWISSPVGVYSTRLSNVLFINNNTGFICGYPNVVIKTTNGGVNWFSIFNISGDNNFNSVMFKNENTGFISARENSFRTTNCGINWTHYPSINGRGAYYGDNIVLNQVYSTDFGLSWIPNNGGINNYIADSLTYYSLYQGQYVSKGMFRTTNKGISWTSIMKIVGDGFSDFKICTPNITYCINSTKIFKTTDGGNNFTVKFNNSQVLLKAVDFKDSSNGIAAGSFGKYIITSNGGNNWNLGTLTGASFLDASYINNIIILLDSSVNRVFISTNAGNNWDAVNISTDQSQMMKFVNLYTGFILTKNYKIYKTTNGGYNWFLLKTFSGVNHFDFYDTNIGIAGNSAKYYRTIDGGVTWDTIPIPFPYRHVSVSLKYTSPKTLYSAGFFGKVYKSTDNGINWNQQSSYSFIGTNIKKIDFLDSLFGFTMDYADILKTTTGGEISVNIFPINSEIPVEYLLKQNYPNPFNPTTKIRFDIPSGFPARTSRNDKVVLKVYDVMGREVQTLVNERLQPGSYETSFDGSGLNSGVYFYKITAGNFTETKRMLLIK